MRARVLVMVMLVVLFGGSGCFVWDELNAGEEELERYSGKPSAAKAADPAPGARPGASTPPSPDDRARQWWQSARSIVPGEGDSSLVRCRDGESILFTHDADCQTRGGTVLD